MTVTNIITKSITVAMTITVPITITVPMATTDHQALCEEFGTPGEAVRGQAALEHLLEEHAKYVLRAINFIIII